MEKKEKLEFRDLREDEIEVRVAQAKQNGVQLLLYKDARTDMNILDETVGCENWQCRFYEHKGILFCSVGINTNYNRPDLPDRWVWKDDAGSESNMEAEKGNASDARKRSGTAWNIGRELYTSPYIWVEPENCVELKQIEVQGRKVWKCFDSFTVKKIIIENKRIVALAIKNNKNRKWAFVWQDPEWEARNAKKGN